MKNKMIVLTLIASLFTSASMAQDRPPRGEQPRGNAQGYSIEQAVSEEAQLHTIAFNGLAFITGDFGADTFIPPGKVCDFFGFQYMRDIDTAGKGHNPMFLDRVAGNVLKTMKPTSESSLRPSPASRRFRWMSLPANAGRSSRGYAVNSQATSRPGALD